jgi:diguanylate cyclase (GGDEF)-like protein
LVTPVPLAASRGDGQCDAHGDARPGGRTWSPPHPDAQDEFVQPSHHLRLYSTLSRLPRPRSYGGKILLVAFIGTHVPLLALVGYVAASTTGWTAAARVLGVALAATVFGTAATLFLLHRLLAPISLTYQALRTYITHQEVSHLPTAFTDEAGVLMADTQHAIGRLDEMIRHLAGYDAATGLPNRALFRERVREASARARRTGRPYAVITIDLDRFSAVNAALGPAAGDEVLVSIGQRLAASMREGDVLARIDGDEFAVLAVDHGNTGAVVAFAQRLLEALRRPVVVGGRDVRVTASLGVALFPVDGDDPDALLTSAAAAVRAARETGGDAYRFYAGALNAGLERRLMLEADLPAAVERGELRVFYQPKVRLSDGRVTSAEALVRWVHPALGVVGPGEFIPVAEAAGIIGAVGEWVLRAACEQVVAWDAAGLAPSRLEVEITEGVLLDNERHAAQVLGSLRAAGVTVALDDFGTGYSSLAYLHRLPVDVVKIDRQFVHGLPGDVGSDAIVAAVIALARALGLSVVAEGVETEAQRVALAERGCDVAQGFYFGAAMPALEFAATLKGAASPTAPLRRRRRI